MDARTRFERTRRAVTRLREVQHLIMYDCDDWKPPSVKSHSETSDPTANRAAYNVDELAEKLKALRDEERELIQLIGETLVIIRRVREGMPNGDKYADVLDARYIDGDKWNDIAGRFESSHEKQETVKPRTVQNWAQVAFDWVDSVGVSRLLRGESEL